MAQEIQAAHSLLIRVCLFAGLTPRSLDSEVVLSTSPSKPARKKVCAQEAVELGQPGNAPLVSVPRVSRDHHRHLSTLTGTLTTELHGKCGQAGKPENMDSGEQLPFSPCRDGCIAQPF